MSSSRRWVTKRDVPGLRLSSHTWMSASDSGMRGGQPSTTQPIAGPWLSPQVVTRNRWPKVLWDTGAYGVISSVDNGDVRRGRILHADNMVTAIHVVHLAGHARGQIGQQIYPRAADIADRHIALHR